MSSAQDQSVPSAGGGDAGSQRTQQAQQAQQAQQGQQQGQQRIPRPTQHYEDDRYEEPSGAVMSGTVLARVRPIVSGLANFFEGLAAISHNAFYVSQPNYAYDYSVNGWGWIHFGFGIAGVLAGFCLFMDMMWACVVGVILAASSAIINLLYIPYTPFWSLIVMAIDVFVIGGLLAPRRRPGW